MAEWVRVYEKLDPEEVKKALLVQGDLSAECFNCHKVGLKRDVLECPQCGAKFKYFGLRKASQLKPVRHLEGKVKFIDFEDFSREFKRRKAKNLLDI